MKRTKSLIYDKLHLQCFLDIQMDAEWRVGYMNIEFKWEALLEINILELLVQRWHVKP